MIRTFSHTLALVLAVAGATPAQALAQGRSAEPARSSDPAADASAAQDREVLVVAEQLADEVSKILDNWIATKAITEDRLFAGIYFPLPQTEPYKFSTLYDALAQRDLPGPQDRALERSPALQYAIVTDVNAYVPVHNTRFSQALTGNMEQDYIGNRSKRLLGDRASIAAAHSTAPSLVQRVRLETGDMTYEASVPLIVRGRHWGCVRVGYRRAE